MCIFNIHGISCIKAASYLRLDKIKRCDFFSLFELYLATMKASFKKEILKESFGVLSIFQQISFEILELYCDWLKDEQYSCKIILDLYFPSRFKFDIKVCSFKKETTFRNGHFTTISGHFIANYVNIFHKIGVPTVILSCLKCLNLNWIKG